MMACERAFLSRNVLREGDSRAEGGRYAYSVPDAIASSPSCPSDRSMSTPVLPCVCNDLTMYVYDLAAYL